MRSLSDEPEPQTSGTVLAPSESSETLQRLLSDAAATETRARSLRAHILSPGEKEPAQPSPALVALQSSLEQARTRLASYQKEREALTTIFERKLKIMTDNIVSILSASGAESPQPDAVHAVGRQARALQRLVNVSIAALHNAQKQDVDTAPNTVPVVTEVRPASVRAD
eukprot:gnl/Ergobibamus_cyprinoides/1504.p1 GENE.gnl/Ergobibamus_cyprinoides/1504~~gnl/Ergobibamus_cyprinoides/1504.p1  ORF type:complete len:169 (+),score=36.30 gnl/Ergobibamus_cyprinoides/1504:414-920(+)